MPKKCLPGVICLENITLAVLLFLFIVLGYLYYIFLIKVSNKQSTIYVPISSNTNLISNSGTPNIMMDPNIPPLKIDGYSGNIGNRGGIPVNVETRGLSQNYSQVGILTRTNGNEMILPLMGRRLMSGLDKWQYYTISNSGSINTKLPISLRGRKCSGEYGCECVMDSDVVFVEGYQDTFRITLYETASFQYIPYI
jgi:hypothetical protein